MWLPSLDRSVPVVVCLIAFSGACSSSESTNTSDGGTTASGGGGSGGAAAAGGTGGVGAGGTGGVGAGGLVAEGVEGTIAPGEQITINWDGASPFGETGPTLVLFDDFEGADGAEIPLTSPSVGEWTGKNQYYPPLFSTELARSGQSAMLAWDAVEQVQRQLYVTFGDDTEFFLSYWVALPPDSLFPGSDSQVGTFPSDSSWKFTWLMDGPDGYGSEGNYDQCLPTHTGGGSFYLAGNDGNWVTGLGNEWWDWYEWIRITVWGRAAANNPSVDHGDGLFQTLSTNVGLSTRAIDDRPLFQGGTERFNRLNLPGWMRTGHGGAEVRPHYDAIYFATGGGAAARVEIGDASSYGDCTNLALALPVAWSDTEITVELRSNNAFTSLDGAYLFIHDADNALVGESRAITSSR